MKIFILWIMPFVLFASGQKMSVSDTFYFERADKQEMQSIELTTSGRYLIYKASTEEYDLVINALDGTLIQKEPK